MDRAYGPMIQSEDTIYIRGRSTKVEVEIALQEELKGIYDRSNPIRGEKSPWKHLSKVV